MSNGVSTRSWQMTLPTAITVWAIIVATTAVAGVWLGFSGRPFAVALTVAAVLFAFEFWLAAPKVLSRAQTFLGPLALIVPLAAVITYSLGVTGSGRWLIAGAGYAVIPPLLLASAAGKASGTWQDYTAAVFIWIAIWLSPPYRMLYRVFPYPPPLQHTLSILLAISTAVAGYILVRRLEGVGYAVEWKPGFGTAFLLSFFVFAAIAIPLGLKIHFIAFGPNLSRMHPVPFIVSAVGIAFFTAWPEELFFRGILQNCLTRSFKNRWLGLVAASVIFGFSHMLHAPAPNWKYVLLAAIAGLFYGRAYMKTGSIFPGVLVHGLVDFTWHILFR